MQTFYLGIDASKGYADFIILDTHKKVVLESFQLDDTFDGHCLLYELLMNFLADHPDSIICAALESTGGYENNWYNALLEFQGTLNLRTARINPLGVHHNSKADLKRNVTDKISAQSVAEYMIAHPEKVSYQSQDQLANLRKQWGFIKMLTKQCTQILNQLESLLYSANPEILTYCKDGVPAWVLKLLVKYPTAANLARAKVSAISKIPFVSTTKAEALVLNAKKSVASAVDEVTQQLVAATVKQILHLKETIKIQTAIMAKACAVPEVELLKTFIGISDASAIGLILNIQSVKRFKTVKKLAAFFGLHPKLKISGDGVSAVRMSKEGRAEPRQILYMVAMVAITHNPLIRAIYEERVSQGMEKMAAIGLCMHKILRVVYGMLKSNRPFDPEIDRRNRQKPITPRKKRENKIRRYQDYDSKAPISRRQKAKRMEQRQSQSDNGATARDLSPRSIPDVSLP
jgi:transposase